MGRVIPLLNCNPPTPKGVPSYTTAGREGQGACSTSAAPAHGLG
jgi:hypothetical protein